MTRTILLEGVRDYNFEPQTNVADVYVSRLHQKIDKRTATGLVLHKEMLGERRCPVDGLVQ